MIRVTPMSIEIRRPLNQEDSSIHKRFEALYDRFDGDVEFYGTPTIIQARRRDKELVEGKFAIGRSN